MILQPSRAAMDAILLVADWRWRKGPRWRAAMAWAFGKRQVVKTHLGDIANLSWWRGHPYLISIEEADNG